MVQLFCVVFALVIFSMIDWKVTHLSSSLSSLRNSSTLHRPAFCKMWAVFPWILIGFLLTSGRRPHPANIWIWSDMECVMSSMTVSSHRGGQRVNLTQRVDVYGLGRCGFPLLTVSSVLFCKCEFLDWAENWIGDQKQIAYQDTVG